MNLAELKEKTAAGLNMVAKELNVTNTSGLRKQELTDKILRSPDGEKWPGIWRGRVGDPARWLRVS